MRKPIVPADVKDYVVIEYGDKRKKFLAQVTAVGLKGDSLKVVFDGIGRADAETEQSDNIKTTDVIANLGPNPAPGTAYGLKIEPYRKTVHRNNWGVVHFFHQLEPQHEEALYEAMDRIFKTLKSLGLHTEFPLETHIRPPRGMYAGSYRFRPGEKLDLLTLHPKEWGHRRAIEVLLWHELGHYLENRYFSRKQERRWINAYHDNVTLDQTTEADLTELRADFVVSGDLIKDFGKNLDEERGVIWDAIIYWIGTYHALKPKHLDILVEGGDDLKKLWPTDPVFLTNQEVLVTPYANKDPNEFWCEAFCFYQTGGTLPDGEPIPDWIVGLVEDTIDELTDRKAATAPKPRLSSQTPLIAPANDEDEPVRGPRQRAA